MTSKTSIPTLLIATAAGLASAFAFASLVGGSVGVLPVFLLSPLPIALAALGWGTLAGLGASGIAAGALQIGLGTPSAVVLVLSIGLPIVATARLLARRTADTTGAVSWYPLGLAVSALATLVAIATAVGGLAIGFDPQATADQVIAAFRASVVAAGGAAGDAASMEPLLRASVRMMPAFFPAFWTLVLVGNLAITARVARRFALLARPIEDTTAIVVPIAAGLVFAAATALAFLPGSPGLLAAIAAGAAFAPHFLVGLAVLHRVTRGSDMRWIVLAFVYGLVLLVPIAGLLVGLVGLTEPFVGVRGRSSTGPGA